MKPAEDLTTCKTGPSSIKHNVCFLLDVRNLSSKNDWKSGDMGSWKNNGVQHLRYHVGQDEGVILQNDENNEKPGQSFTMKRVYYNNNSSSDVKKIASCLEGMPYLLVEDFCTLSRNEGYQAGFHFFSRAFPSNLSTIYVRRCTNIQLIHLRTGIINGLTHMAMCIPKKVPSKD